MPERRVPIDVSSAPRVHPGGTAYCDKYAPPHAATRQDARHLRRCRELQIAAVRVPARPRSESRGAAALAGPR